MDYCNTKDALLHYFVLRNSVSKMVIFFRPVATSLKHPYILIIIRGTQSRFISKDNSNPFDTCRNFGTISLRRHLSIDENLLKGKQQPTLK